jgi:hypothetical protein
VPGRKRNSNQHNMGGLMTPNNYMKNEQQKLTHFIKQNQTIDHDNRQGYQNGPSHNFNTTQQSKRQTQYQTINNHGNHNRAISQTQGGSMLTDETPTAQGSGFNKTGNNFFQKFDDGGQRNTGKGHQNFN